METAEHIVVIAAACSLAVTSFCVYYVLLQIRNRLSWISSELERANNREAAKDNLDG